MSGILFSIGSVDIGTKLSAEPAVTIYHFAPRRKSIWTRIIAFSFSEKYFWKMIVNHFFKT